MNRKKIIDENGRLFGKLSVIDLAVILIVAVLLVAAYVKFNVMETTSPSVKTYQIEYTLMISGIREQNAALLRPGDAVWTETGTPVGTITSVTTQPATQISQLADGRYVKGSVEDKVDTELVITANCTATNGRYYVERTFEVNVNREHNLVTKYSQFTAYISDISEPVE
jgi:hypothetical protein